MHHIRDEHYQSGNFLPDLSRVADRKCNARKNSNVNSIVSDIPDCHIDYFLTGPNGKADKKQVLK